MITYSMQLCAWARGLRHGSVCTMYSCSVENAPKGYSYFVAKNWKVPRQLELPITRHKDRSRMGKYAQSTTYEVPGLSGEKTKAKKRRRNDMNRQMKPWWLTLWDWASAREEHLLQDRNHINTGMQLPTYRPAADDVHFLCIPIPVSIRQPRWPLASRTLAPVTSSSHYPQGAQHHDNRDITHASDIRDGQYMTHTYT
ncbi:hypothetical protein ACRALDRAFT_213644 [Sodiomyces alcalophilus JCM 7366]|uniref:uncharacterized protein n=1 Tax=Sodiomyces alcalophilus JCM 7366 TaxID=591952 RepID=UPI0039B365DE